MSQIVQPLQPNTPAPEFTLPDQNGENHTLSQYKGKWILLYFYPKDDTPGCTTQACGIRDSFEDYTKVGVIVLGISKDSIKNHKKFEQKYNLPFTLLSDSTTDVAQLYGVWGPKKFMGREFMGLHRTSFLINPEGIIHKTFEKVDVKKHAQEILQAIPNS